MKVVCGARFEFQPMNFLFTLESRLKRRSLCIETKMENRQSRRKKFCSGQIGKVRFVEELELYKIVQDHIFRKCIKTSQKNSSFIRLGFVPEFHLCSKDPRFYQVFMRFRKMWS